MKAINVVAAIIWNTQKSHILIAKRPEHVHKGGYWEFPGGKVETGETNEQALARELKEELSVRFTAAKLFKSVHFDYPEKSVDLSFYQVNAIDAYVLANEGQEWRWVPIETVKEYRFPEANAEIIEALADECRTSL